MTWKPIPGYADYEASSNGEIRNNKTNHVTLGGVAGRYRKVSVYPTNSKKAILEYVHILVCTAFHGKPKEGQVVLHGDDDRLNNKPSNLSWGSQSDNVQSAYDNGLRK